MTATVLRLVPQLDREVPPPAWGEDFQRIRKSSYKAAASLLVDLERIGVEVSTATISRLESSDAPPTDVQREVAAVATLVLCNVHPETMGLSIDALPRRVYTALFATGPDDTGGQETTSTRWYGGRVVDLGARRGVPTRQAA